MKKLRISLVSDLHLGYNSSLNHVKKMVKMINDSNSDLVVMAGDIFDNNYSSISKPKEVISELKKIKSKYGVYAVCGNHDIDEKILAGFTFSFKKGKKLIDSKMEEFFDYFLVFSPVNRQFLKMRKKFFSLFSKKHLKLSDICGMILKDVACKADVAEK